MDKCVWLFWINESLNSLGVRRKKMSKFQKVWKQNSLKVQAIEIWNEKEDLIGIIYFNSI